MNKIKSILGLVLLLIACTSAIDDNSSESVVKSYYEAYNRKDYSKLKTLISDNIVVKEMGYTVIQTKDAFIDLVEWGEVLNSKNKLKKLSGVNGKIVVKETQNSDRVKLLYGKPIKAKTTFTVSNQKITQIEVELIDFDQNRMTRRKDHFENWIVIEHSVNLSAINRLNRAGGEVFKKAMELYQNR